MSLIATMIDINEHGSQFADDFVLVDESLNRINSKLELQRKSI